MSDEFEDKVGKMLPPLPGYPHLRWSTAQLLAGWSSMVDAVSSGYDDNIYEYDNDLAERDFLGRVLSDRSLALFPELEGLANEVGRIDARFRTMVTPVPVRRYDGSWWHECLPLAAGGELRDDMLDQYGHEAKLVDDNE